MIRGKHKNGTIKKAGDMEIVNLGEEGAVIKTSPNPGITSNIYITTEIGDPQEYIELVDLLHSAKDEDNINIYLNTPGGNSDAMIMVVNALSDTAGTTTAYITGTVASAGTAIALACDNLVPMAYSEFMIHTYSMGTYGKSHEIAARVDFTNKQWENFARDVYTPFLTDEELSAVLRGEDKYFSAEEVAVRWQRVIDFRISTVEDVQKASQEDDTDMVVEHLISKGYKITKPKKVG